MERRLAAILAADMVGYSRAMQVDEVGTLAALTAFRKEAIEPLVAAHRGRIVKLMGDGVLAEFASVVDAVTCAIAWQERAAREQFGKPLQFRIGVNLGDIVFEDGDIFGTGVNVAARLQTLAAPGEICLSGTVHGEVRNKLDVAYEDLGDQTVKNIEGPVRAWRIATRRAAMPLATTKPASKAYDKPSVAVLPFANMSGDPEQEYFSDGISEDIITEVSRFRELFVTARNSSFAFKGQNPDIRTVGEKLGVQFVVEGSVRRAGNRVRVTAQLIEAVTGNHVWAERYDRDLADIFEVQDEVARAIASTVAGKVRSTATDQIRRRPTENMTAYEYYLRGIGSVHSYVDRDGHAVFGENLAFLKKAVELDPEFAAARAAIAIALTIENFVVHDSSILNAALAQAQQSVVLDPNDSRGHLALGFVLMNLHRLDEAKIQIELSLNLNPNDSWARGCSGFCLMYLGRLDEALAEIDFALRVDPFVHDWIWDGRGTILMLMHRYEDAVDALKRLSRQTSWTLVWQAICLARLGRVGEARQYLAQHQAIEPGRSIDEAIDGEAFRDTSVHAWLKAALRDAGLVDARGNPVPVAPGPGPVPSAS
jgi:adenylate cyclase